MTYHYHGIDAEESILTNSLPNLGTWALPSLFFSICLGIQHSEENSCCKREKVKNLQMEGVKLIQRDTKNVAQHDAQNNIFCSTCVLAECVRYILVGPKQTRIISRIFPT